MDESSSEYMKIRRYVMTLIYRFNGKSVLLPSIQELADRFHVSRPTVSRAMKTLTTEEFVIGRRGIGSFTNPAKCYVSAGKPLPIIGILMGDGRWIHFEQYLGHMLSEAIAQIVDMPAVMHMITLGGNEEESIQRELENENPDALFAYGGASKTVRALEVLAKKGLPIVIVNSEEHSDLLSEVRIDYEQWGYECGKKLLEHGCRHVVIYPCAPAWNMPVEGIRKAYAERGIPLNENLFLKHPHTAISELKQILSYGVPVDAVCNLLTSRTDLSDILKQEMKHRTNCLIVQSTMAGTIPEEFPSLRYEVPFRKVIREAIQLLRRKMENPNGKMEKIRVPIVWETKKMEKERGF